MSKGYAELALPLVWASLGELAWGWGRESRRAGPTPSKLQYSGSRPSPPSPRKHSRAVPDWGKLWDGVVAFGRMGLAPLPGGTVELVQDVGVAGELAPSS